MALAISLIKDSINQISSSSMFDEVEVKNFIKAMSSQETEDAISKSIKNK